MLMMQMQGEVILCRKHSGIWLIIGDHLIRSMPESRTFIALPTSLLPTCKGNIFSHKVMMPTKMCVKTDSKCF